MKIDVQKISSTQCILAFALFTACAVQAQTEAPLSSFYTPSYRGLSASESAFWSDSFTNAYDGPNTVSSTAPGGSTLADASVTQTTPGAFIIGGVAGDIYSYSSINTFELSYTLSNPANFPNGISDIVFQTETVGAELDYSSVLLSYDTGLGTQTLSTTRRELYRDTENTEFGPSFDVVSKWEWSLPTGTGVTDFLILFDGSGTSVGLERVMLDVSPVPEPGTAGLLGMAGLGLACFWLFRRQRWC